MTSSSPFRADFEEETREAEAEAVLDAEADLDAVAEALFDEASECREEAMDEKRELFMMIRWLGEIGLDRTGGSLVGQGVAWSHWSLLGHRRHS